MHCIPKGQLICICVIVFLDRDLKITNSGTKTWFKNWYLRWLFLSPHLVWIAHTKGSLHIKGIPKLPVIHEILLEGEGLCPLLPIKSRHVPAILHIWFHHKLNIIFKFLSENWLQNVLRCPSRVGECYFIFELILLNCVFF